MPLFYFSIYCLLFMDYYKIANKGEKTEVVFSTSFQNVHTTRCSKTFIEHFGIKQVSRFLRMWFEHFRVTALRTLLVIIVGIAFIFLILHNEITPQYNQLIDDQFFQLTNIVRQPPKVANSTTERLSEGEVLCQACVAPKQLQPFAQNYIAVRYHNGKIHNLECVPVISEVVITKEMNINAICNALTMNFSYKDQKILESLQVKFVPVEDEDELKFMAFIHVLNHLARKSYSIDYIHDYGSRSFSKNVNMWYWDEKNWGDLLGPVMVEKLSGVPTTNNKQVRNPKADPEFFSVGSLLQWMYVSRRCFSWGSGHKELPSSKETMNAKFPEQKIFSVRGYESQVAVLANTGTLPHVAMDPALLAVKLFYPANLTGEYEFCLLPHMSDFKYLNENFPQGTPHSVNPAIHLIPVNKVANPFRKHMSILPAEMAKCRRVLASSLHAMILGHAFGIPTAGVQIGNQSPRRTKYRDHYESLDIYLTFDRIKPALNAKQLVNVTHLKALVDSTPQPKRPIDLQPIIDTYPFPIIQKWRSIIETDHWLS